MRSTITTRLRLVTVTGLALGLLVGAQAGTALAARAPKPPAAPIITAKASTGTIGESLNLTVVVKTSGKVATVSAGAVAHFPSGDVTARLPKVVKGKTGASLTGTVAVPADVEAGSVVVDFTIVYAGVTYTRSVVAAIEPAPTPTPSLEATAPPAGG